MWVIRSFVKKSASLLHHSPVLKNLGRLKIRTPSGGIVAEPSRNSTAILGIFVTVISGLLIGAAISKNIANFLEENDLFVPSDDDDDDY